jgi:hypothetical protein
MPGSWGCLCAVLLKVEINTCHDTYQQEYNKSFPFVVEPGCNGQKRQYGKTGKYHGQILFQFIIHFKTLLRKLAVSKVRICIDDTPGCAGDNGATQSSFGSKRSANPCASGYLSQRTTYGAAYYCCFPGYCRATGYDLNFTCCQFAHINLLTDVDNGWC